MNLEMWLILESLNRYLRYLAISEITPLMATEKLLANMVKQGYLARVKDTDGGEARFDYHLGPRGKAEVGRKGTLEFVKAVIIDLQWPNRIRLLLIKGLWR